MTGLRSLFSRKPVALGQFFFALAAELLLIAGVTHLSSRFEFGGDELQRPVIQVVLLLLLATVAQFFALSAVLRLRWNKRLAASCFLFALIFRLMLLATHPILEVDLYRYIWDGAVTAQGTSPYRNSPDSVLVGRDTDPSLRELDNLLVSQPGLDAVLERVHYAQFTTVYPPVSQAVFAFSSTLMPLSATPHQRVVLMKAVLMCFDLGTLLLLGRLIQMAGRHGGWVILYGWSPLVLKEFSNSGHLDSIAIFLTVAAVLLLVMASSRPEPKHGARSLALFSAFVLALAVAAKIYPLILVPAFLVFVRRNFGHRLTAMWTGTLLTASVLLLAPMMLHLIRPDNEEPAGLAVFLSHWEMNDLIFMAVQENLRPEGAIPGQPKLWFVAFPDAARVATGEAMANLFSMDRARVPFMLSRCLTVATFALIALGLAWRQKRSTDGFAGTLFLTLAWFWFLSPTQNPWYWIWGIPFVVFASNWGWHLVAGLSLLYYSRFWFHYHEPEWIWMGSRYRGTQLFDFLIIWAEHGPALFAIALVAWGSCRRGAAIDTERPGRAV